MPFKPEEILFASTLECNLSCPHCLPGPVRRSAVLPSGQAIKFMKGCRRLGVKKVGFTGGEPFLRPGFIRDVVRAAVREEMAFGRIMTNGVWWTSLKLLRRTLSGVRDAGYDGSLCVSFDGLHAQDPVKTGRFIIEAANLWRRPDIVSIAAVRGARDEATIGSLRSLARSVSGRIGLSPAGNHYIESAVLFIKVDRIDLSPIGKAAELADPWDGRWFREDRCEGPGNSLFVMPDGGVKPCCGYASHNDALTVGNIRRDSARSIMARAQRNRFASAVFNSGLSRIRKGLERAGIRFPGRTSNHCFFCDYILNYIPKEVLDRCL